MIGMGAVASRPGAVARSFSFILPTERRAASPPLAELHGL